MYLIFPLADPLCMRRQWHHVDRNIHSILKYTEIFPMHNAKLMQAISGPADKAQTWQISRTALQMLVTIHKSDLIISILLHIAGRNSTQFELYNMIDVIHCNIAVLTLSGPRRKLRGCDCRLSGTDNASCFLLLILFYFSVIKQGCTLKPYSTSWLFWLWRKGFSSWPEQWALL